MSQGKKAGLGTQSEVGLGRLQEKQAARTQGRGEYGKGVNSAGKLRVSTRVLVWAKVPVHQAGWGAKETSPFAEDGADAGNQVGRPERRWEGVVRGLGYRP